MYRLLIVDDEKLIIDGLIDLFQRSDFRDHLDLYKAGSASEALRIMKAVKMDIVITDVQMPGLSGIEFHHKIRGEWPLCKVIYLTGYDQFEYAQSAIRNAGTDFILKTEGEERILEAFHKAVTAIDTDLKNREYIEKSKRQMQLALPSLQKNFLFELLNGAEYAREQKEKQFVELEIALNAHIDIYLVMGRVDRWPADMSFTQRMERIYRIQNLLNQHLMPAVTLFPVILDDASLLWIIQPVHVRTADGGSRDEQDIWQKVVSLVRGTVDLTQKTISELAKITISFIISRSPSSWENISDDFDRMKYKLSRAAGAGEEISLIDGSEAHETKAEAAVYVQLKKTDTLAKLLDAGKKDEFLDTLGKMLDNIRGLISLEDGIAAEVFYSISTLFMAYLHKSKLINQSTVPLSVNLDKLVKLGEHQSWEQLIAFFKEVAEFIFHEKAEDYKMSTRKIIDTVYDYIEQNPGKDLSLSKLAELSRFSPCYLTRLYKQMTGKSISEHIWEVKLNRAKEYLRTSNLKISEIALSLGFNTPSYFTYFFKKNMNVSPQEYRDS